MKLENILSEIKDKNVIKYLKFVKNYLEKNNIALHLDGNLSRIGAHTHGYFSEKEGIRCFVNPKDQNWILTLSHELHHCTTYLKNSKDWRDYQNLELSMEQIEKMKTLPPNRIKICRVLINLEWGAENAAIKATKKYNLPVNLDSYIQEANFTLYRYSFLSHEGIFPILSNKNNGELIKLMPTKLINKKEFIWSKMPAEIKLKLDAFRIK